MVRGNQRDVEVGPGDPVIGRRRHAEECRNGEGRQDGWDQQHGHRLDEGDIGIGTDVGLRKRP